MRYLLLVVLLSGCSAEAARQIAVDYNAGVQRGLDRDAYRRAARPCPVECFNVAGGVRCEPRC